MSGPLTVQIVAPDRVLWSGDADFVSAPAADGALGLLPGHESVLALLRAGAVRVRAGGDVTEFPVEQGFLSFDANVVTVVVGGRH
ncbi:F0F1 ATP synthase subunit epsilon [Miniimonas sp. S16]|uniref:F0F1 ATP synthase subunit epsilon n=1 Tax=Miniimonas sp. S16 TaxID=2171623 RepID=UPI000D5298C0|nr:F0F1 ATP synthase subunit epsilon [Miniimonas sp. S16]